jgi:hypothetical protein
VLSLASYEAQARQQRLREQLNLSRWQIPLDLSLALFCLGLLLTGRRWWEWTIWALMVALFLAQAVHWRCRRGSAPTSAEPHKSTEPVE